MFEFYKLKKLVKKALNNKERYKHSIYTAKLSYKLAKIHGYDPKIAKIAGLFHDFAKYFTKSEYKAYLKDDEFLKNKEFIQLYHGPCAARYFKSFLFENQDIYNAIYFHTVCNKDMNLLSKIVFIADKAEKSRKYNEVEQIRKEMYYDIDYAFLLTLESDIAYLKMHSIKPLDQQVLTYNYYKEKVWKNSQL